nr:aminotransferase class IV [Rhodopirellula baltica]
MLKGVTIGLLRGWANVQGISCLESPLMPDDLHAADEILLAGTDTGVWFANRCGQGEAPRQRGAVCRMMQEILLRSANRPNSGV